MYLLTLKKTFYGRQFQLFKNFSRKDYSMKTDIIMNYLFLNST